MATKNIITISGLPGSGKSTTGKLLASKLGYQHFSTGDMMRRLGAERGLDITSTNIANESDRSLDDLVDGELRRINEQDDNLVIDSRMAWHFIPSAFTIYLHLDRSVAADRVLADTSDKARLQSEIISSDKREYIADMEKRLASEEKRYRELYDVNPYDESNYNLVIDTEHHTPDEVVELILTAYANR